MVRAYLNTIWMTLCTPRCKSTTPGCYFYVFLLMVQNSTLLKKCVFYDSFFFGCYCDMVRISPSIEFPCFYQFLHDVIIKLFCRSKQNNFMITSSLKVDFTTSFIPFFSRLHFILSSEWVARNLAWVTMYLKIKWS